MRGALASLTLLSTLVFSCGNDQASVCGALPPGGCICGAMCALGSWVCTACDDAAVADASVDDGVPAVDSAGAGPTDAAVADASVDDGVPAVDSAGAGPTDASPDSSEGGETCPAGLPDAGFTTLADLPIAKLCAESAMAYGGSYESVRESVPGAGNPCQSSNLVIVLVDAGPDCGEFMLFDATTGALQAVGAECNGEPTCNGAVPGFSFPSQCFGPWAWIEQRDYCADGGTVNDG
jgi:hypothetical protein